MQLWILVPITIALSTLGCSSGSKNAKSAPATATQQKSATEAKQAAKEAVKSTQEAVAAGTDNSKGPKVQCSAKGDVRLLEIRGKGNGCELGYTKGGQEGIVASDSQGSEHCQKTLAKIKERLLGSGFSCQ